MDCPIVYPAEQRVLRSQSTTGDDDRSKVNIPFTIHDCDDNNKCNDHDDGVDLNSSMNSSSNNNNYNINNNSCVSDEDKRSDVIDDDNNNNNNNNDSGVFADENDPWPTLKKRRARRSRFFASDPAWDFGAVVWHVEPFENTFARFIDCSPTATSPATTTSTTDKAQRCRAPATQRACGLAPLLLPGPRSLAAGKRNSSDTDNDDGIGSFCGSATTLEQQQQHLPEPSAVVYPATRPRSMSLAGIYNDFVANAAKAANAAGVLEPGGDDANAISAESYAATQGRVRSLSVDARLAMLQQSSNNNNNNSNSNNSDNNNNNSDNNNNNSTEIAARPTTAPAFEWRVTEEFEVTQQRVRKCSVNTRATTVSTTCDDIENRANDNDNDNDNGHGNDGDDDDDDDNDDVFTEQASGIYDFEPPEKTQGRVRACSLGAMESAFAATAATAAAPASGTIAPAYTSSSTFGFDCRVSEPFEQTERRVRACSLSAQEGALDTFDIHKNNEVGEVNVEGDEQEKDALDNDENDDDGDDEKEDDEEDEVREVKVKSTAGTERCHQNSCADHHAHNINGDGITTDDDDDDNDDDDDDNSPPPLEDGSDDYSDSECLSEPIPPPPPGACSVMLRKAVIRRVVSNSSDSSWHFDRNTASATSSLCDGPAPSISRSPFEQLEAIRESSIDITIVPSPTPLSLLSSSSPLSTNDTAANARLQRRRRKGYYITRENFWDSLQPHSLGTGLANNSSYQNALGEEEDDNANVVNTGEAVNPDPASTMTRQNTVIHHGSSAGTNSNNVNSKAKSNQVKLSSSSSSSSNQSDELATPLFNAAPLCNAVRQSTVVPYDTKSTATTPTTTTISSKALHVQDTPTCNNDRIFAFDIQPVQNNPL